MTIDDFRRSITDAHPPPHLASALIALWHDARGEWERAHEVAQNIDGPVGAWVHAYLHRKEGDVSNAGYWYRRASKPVATGTLDGEWERIVTELLVAAHG